jgi:ribosomal protein S18 acetylase RimI-like enzyme
VSNSAFAPNVSGKPQAIARPVRTAEVVPALRMILGADGQLADESQARELMKFTAQRGINLADIWISEIGGRLAWAVLPVVSPGRTVLYFGTARSLVGADLEPMEIGLEAVCRHHAQRDIQLAQALLDPADGATIDIYQRNGFQRMADLIYMQRSIRRASQPPPLPAEFGLVNYSPQTHAGFAAAVAASYQDSLDCPALNGLRDIEDTLAGHKSAGPFDPRDWFLLTRGESPVAVLLLSRTHIGDGMELVYLGLSPQVRGLGLGNYLMQVAESRVKHHKLDKLTLAVDAINAPAIKLYHRHGLQQVGIKAAMMRMLGGKSRTIPVEHPTSK